MSKYIFVETDPGKMFMRDRYVFVNQIKCPLGEFWYNKMLVDFEKYKRKES